MVSKATLNSQKGKYNDALTSIDSAIIKLGNINDILKVKKDFNHSRIDTIIEEIEDAISDLTNMKKGVNSAIYRVQKAIDDGNYDDEEIDAK